jgi:hypothetical protein
MINKSINSKIDQLVGQEEQAIPSMAEITQEQEMPSSDVFTGEEVQVAGLKGAIEAGIGAIKGGVKESLKPLEEKGARTLREPKVVAPTQRRREIAPAKTTPVQVEIPNNPTPLNVKPKSNKVIEDIGAARAESLEQGATPVSPTPGPRDELVLDNVKFEEVGSGRISTVPFDDASLRTTIEATAQKFVSDDIKSTTVQKLYDSAVERGIPETMAQKILNGVPFESKIGDNQLAVNMSGMLKLMDDSSAYIDSLFKKLDEDFSSFTDIDRFNLGQQLAYHESIMNSVSGASSDIARAMNTFKRAKDTMPILDGPEFKAILDGTISKEAMLELAKRYNTVESRAGKNALIKQQKGLYTKIGEGMYYTFQSNMLNDPATISRNINGSLMQGAFITVEDILGVGVSKIRAKIGNELGDTQELDDVMNGLSGFFNGVYDGFESMSNVIRTGERATFKGETVNNPLSSAYLADTEFTVGFGKFAQTFKTDPDLENTFFGKAIDAIGFVQSIPFRGLSGTDELITGTVARMALHREASKFARSRIKELTGSGTKMEDAVDTVSKELATFLREQPADVYANVEEVRQMVNFSYKFNKFAEGTVERNVAGAYDKAARLFDIPGFKILQPFAGTVTKIIDQGASRMPGANFISPQFYKDWNRGGAYQDRAIARLTLGSTIAATTALLAMENKCTGYGPSAPEDRAALQKLGWQPYSCVFTDEFSEENIKRLEKITKVSVGEGKTYISLQGMGAEPLSQIFALGADFGDAMKFYNDDPSSSELGNVAMAIAGSNANYVSNMPLMGAIGDILSISRGKYEDNGEKVVAIFERIATQFSKAGMMSVPGVSIIGSNAANHLAKLIDRPAASIMPDTMNPSPADRIMQESWKNFATRIPVLRGEFDMELDNAGRPKYNRNTYVESYINFIPNMSVTKGQMSRMDEVLVENNHGISKPSKNIDGVEMNAAQYNRFKRLYGQEITLEVLTDNGIERMNMEKAIPAELEQAIKDREISGMSPMDILQRQETINATISKYRKAAKERMLGYSEKDESTGKTIYTGSPVMGEDYGFSDDKVEFPELVNEINRQ